MNHEINMFACAQKEQNGLDKAVEVRFKRPMASQAARSKPLLTARRPRCAGVQVPHVSAAGRLSPLSPCSTSACRSLRRSRYGVTPNMLIIPPQLSL